MSMVFLADSIYIPIDNDYQYQLWKIPLNGKRVIFVIDELLVIIII